MMGAIAAVQGGGRVEKYRHYLYEWLGVDKVELAVMAELLLRGAQTEGDLRGRVSRMDPIADLTTMRSLLDSLRAKGLVQAITPEGRGQILSHTLYMPEELEKVKRQHAEHAASVGAGPPPVPRPAAVAPMSSSAHAEPPRAPAASDSEVSALRRELTELRTVIAELRAELADVAAQSQENADLVEELRQSLGG
jgi:uncharacterized protein YceH (UPF0502 family)